ncbi:MAG: AIM24 family protein [Solirubrobacterales bacterium]
MAVEQALAQFKETEGGEAFRLQNSKLLKVELAGVEITANGPHVLAFDAGIEWDIKRVEGASGALSGGLYNMELSGTGNVALVSDGPPVLIEIDGESTFADPQAAITWSQGV